MVKESYNQIFRAKAYSWLLVYVPKLSPSPSQLKLKIGLSLDLFPIYPATRPPDPTTGPAEIVDLSPRNALSSYQSAI